MVARTKPEKSTYLHQTGGRSGVVRASMLKVLVGEKVIKKALSLLSNGWKETKEKLTKSKIKKKMENMD